MFFWLKKLSSKNVESVFYNNVTKLNSRISESKYNFWRLLSHLFCKILIINVLHFYLLKWAKSFGENYLNKIQIKRVLALIFDGFRENSIFKLNFLKNLGIKKPFCLAAKRLFKIFFTKKGDYTEGVFGLLDSQIFYGWRNLSYHTFYFWVAKFNYSIPK